MSNIHVMQPKGFLLGLADGSSIVHVNKSEKDSPRRYTTIQSTKKLSSDGYVYIKTKKGTYH